MPAEHGPRPSKRQGRRSHADTAGCPEPQTSPRGLQRRYGGDHDGPERSLVRAGPGGGDRRIGHGGADAYHSRAILFALDDVGVNVVSGDVVEVAPHYEGPAQITALAGASIAADITYLIAHNRREPPPRPDRT